MWYLFAATAFFWFSWRAKLSRDSDIQKAPNRFFVREAQNGLAAACFPTFLILGIALLLVAFYNMKY
jgi:hypothetical protein